MELLRDGRIATIDGLRGLAIALVVWFHYWQMSWQAAVIPVVNLSLQPIAETGFLGVALFFFISGFVLLLPYAHARATGARPPSWRQFFSRRFLKIVPSYVLAIGTLIAIGYQTYSNGSFALKDIAFHLLFVHDWFAATNGSIDGVMWSLGDEIQFYLLFPLIAGTFVRRPLTATILMFAIANAWRLWCVTSNHYFYEQRLAQLPGYIDFFASGMLGAWLYVRIAAQQPALAERRGWFTLLALGGFAACIALADNCFLHRYDAEWPQLWSVEWRSALALAFLATALGSLFARPPLQRATANPVLLFLAAISYNLYLWHQPVAHILLKLRVPPIATADPHDDPLWQLTFWAVAVPVAVAASALITYGFERPLLRLGKRALRAPRAPVPLAPETVAVTAET